MFGELGKNPSPIWGSDFFRVLQTFKHNIHNKNILQQRYILHVHVNAHSINTCNGDVTSNFTSLSSHFLTMMSSPVMSLILYIMFVADSCASRMTPTIATLKQVQQA